MTKQFKQNIQFKAKAVVLYNLLMEAEKHSAFTGGDAQISKKIGGKFSAYDGYIEGINLELIPGKKIVQSWRAVEDGWPVGIYSEIEFLFIENKNGTELQFTHKNIPSQVKSDFEKGWIDFYWKPMKQFLGE